MYGSLKLRYGPLWSWGFRLPHLLISCALLCRCELSMNIFRSSPSAGDMSAAAADSSTRTWSISSRASTVSVSSSSSSSGASNNGGAYDHQLQAMPAEEEEVVGVAVGKEVKECKANLMWVLSNMDAILMTGSRSSDKQPQKKKATVVLLHVHRPAKTIPFMGANFPADQLHDSEVTAFRQAETEAMNRAMTKYRVMCARVKVQAVCKVATLDAADDVAQGILSLVAQNGITRLVVGAAADKRYTKKMMAPTSKTAVSVQQQAPPRCTLWFLCKGNLICTRLATAPIPVSRSMKSDEDAAAAAERNGGPVVQQPLGTFIQGLGRDSTSSFGDEAPPPPPSISRPGYQQLPPAVGGGSDSEMMMYNKQKQDVQSIFEEAEKLRRERHIIPNYYHQVQVPMSQHHQVALDSMMSQHHHQVEELELQVLSSKRVINDLQDKLSEAHCMLFSLERDQEDLRRQRDDAVREAAALRDKVRQLEDQLVLARGFTELSYDELREATNNMDEALKLQGTGGGYGSVYKAVLHGRHEKKAVAIKVLNPHGLQQQQQVVEELRKLRHPNLVTLLGACLQAPEQASALVYEYLPATGSLDDRLPHLPWADRTRIAAEICSALVFLHQNHMVHGDLKPGNVLLLDDGLTAKLTDYGLCRMLDQADAGAVLMRCATSLAYMDPEFLASGELRPSSDVYAFGVLLLRLLTGRPAMGLLKQVQAALLLPPEGRLPDILDAAAGEWPYPQEQAEQLARLAVACCEIASTNRPDLAGEMVAHTLGCFLHH